MSVEQGFDWLNAAILFGSTSFGAIAGVLVQQRLSKAKPKLHVTSCELSSSLLSRVDYLEMPDSISAKFASFPWKLTIDDEQISSTANILPVGYAQENLYYLAEFLPKSEVSLKLIKDQIGIFKQGSSDDKRKSVEKILHDPILVRSLMGQIRKSNFSVFKNTEFLKNLDLKGEKAVLPWGIDDASGVGKGTFGSFTIHIRDARITFPFQWEDEKQRMAIISFLLASVDEVAVPLILSELADELNDERSIANDMYLWFKENIDLNSTFVCNATITNMGKSPALFSGKGSLKIDLPDGLVVDVPCYSETYTEGTEEDRSVTRTVKVLRHISKLLDTAIPVRKRVITEKALVAESSHETITLRTEVALNELNDGLSILNLYKSRKLRASLILHQEVNTNIKILVSEKFVFASSIA